MSKEDNHFITAVFFTAAQIAIIKYVSEENRKMHTQIKYLNRKIEESEKKDIAKAVNADIKELAEKIEANETRISNQDEKINEIGNYINRLGRAANKVMGKVNSLENQLKAKPANPSGHVSPEQVKPEQVKPEQASSEPAASAHTKPEAVKQTDQAVAEQSVTDHVSYGQASPEQASPEQVSPEQVSPEPTTSEQAMIEPVAPEPEVSESIESNDKTSESDQPEKENYLPPEVIRSILIETGHDPDKTGNFNAEIDTSNVLSAIMTTITGSSSYEFNKPEYTTKFTGDVFLRLKDDRHIIALLTRVTDRRTGSINYHWVVFDVAENDVADSTPYNLPSLKNVFMTRSTFSDADSNTLKEQMVHLVSEYYLQKFTRNDRKEYINMLKMIRSHKLGEMKNIYKVMMRKF